MKRLLEWFIGTTLVVLFPVISFAAQDKGPSDKAIENVAAKLTPPSKETLKLVAAKKPAAAKEKFIDLSLNFSNGYRSDHFKELIGAFPDVLSELTWKHLDIYEIQGSGKVLIANFFYARGSVDWGKILGGHLQDSDFSGQNKTDEFSRTKSETDGHVFDGTVGGGVQFRPKLTKILTFSPLVGWSYHRQKFSDSHFNQIIPPEGSFPAPFDGTGITEKATWQGPWVGADFTLDATSKLILNGTFEYHFADFKGVDNHVFREELGHPSFIDTGDADGIVVVGGASYFLTQNLALTLNVSYQTWSTDGAHGRVFLADGSSENNGPFEADWWSVNVLGGATWRF